ncbi:hypothetical protein ANO11243_034380 [Dothideomycetidae sp. 11243]|nr:hypothetical protein ANO11243_034380 [fungal sp. No.11243]
MDRWKRDGVESGGWRMERGQWIPRMWPCCDPLDHRSVVHMRRSVPATASLASLSTPRTRPHPSTPVHTRPQPSAAIHTAHVVTSLTCPVRGPMFHRRTPLAPDSEVAFPISLRGRPFICVLLPITSPTISELILNRPRHHGVPVMCWASASVDLLAPPLSHPVGEMMSMNNRPALP